MSDPTDIKARRSKRTVLTSNAIFQLWKAALKDDEELLNAIIASVYEQMMSLNQSHAEQVISLIVRRHRDAKEVFKAMLVAATSRDRTLLRHFRSSHCGLPVTAINGQGSVN